MRHPGILRGDFAKNVLVLISGTGIAQAIPVLISPVLTRLYAPEDFGVFALYTAVVSVVGILATGRYELAVMLPKRQTAAINVVALAILATMAVSAATLILVLAFGAEISHYLGRPAGERWLYLVPAGVMLTGTYQTFNYWSGREGSFKNVALTRVSQNAVTAFTQVFAAYSGRLAGGLVIGGILGQTFSVSALAALSFRANRRVFRSITRSRIGACLAKYRNYPLVGVWGALLDSAATQMPIFLISKFFGDVISGLFSMTFKIMNMPMSLIAGSISQVLFRKFSQLSSEHPGLIYSYVVKTFIFLLLVVIPFVLIAFSSGVEIFSFVFGERWATAGSFAGLMSIAIAARFCVSPLSSLLALECHLKKAVYWQILYFLTITITILCFVSSDINRLILAFAIHEVVLYGLYFIVILSAARQFRVR